MRHMLRIMGVPRHDGEAEGDAQRLRRLCHPDGHLALLGMAVLGMPPHRQFRFVPEIHQRRPIEDHIGDLRTVFPQHPLPEGRHDLLPVLPQAFHRPVHGLHVDLIDAEPVPDDRIHHELVGPEYAEVVTELVRHHKLCQFGQVRALGLEARDDPVQPVSPEECLRKEDVPDGNRYIVVRPDTPRSCSPMFVRHERAYRNARTSSLPRTLENALDPYSMCQS